MLSVPPEHHLSVNPARAGMIPGAYEPVDWRDGKPRASGDDPGACKVPIM